MSDKNVQFFQRDSNTGIMTPLYPDPSGEKITADKRQLNYKRGALIPLVLPLDTAQSMKEFQLSGDVLYLDRRSTGEIRFKLDTAWPAAFPLAANSALRGFPYSSLLLEWDAQPGKIAYLWAGYGVEIVPPNQDITTIGSITNPIDVDSITNPIDVNPVDLTEDARYRDDITRDGEHAFSASYHNSTGGGSFGHIMLWNPVGSNVIVYCDSCHWTGANGQPFSIRTHNALGGFTLRSTGINHNVGGAAGKAGVYSNDVGSILGSNPMKRIYFNTGQGGEISFNAPVRLEEGKGLLGVCETAGTTLHLGFSWRERAA